ncbi:iron-containing alcohol dehydrogenase [Cohnella fermenti]|uniref:Iron-containing alcohol dehydrogenase n=1 Tax=Cohnella fermenti TaxID=2565925 RepID=A0A4S4BZ21_9BACL|nr:iron-containing alcohol dehydrogenase [Cohnella fermenti]THF78457.1 iron-containing alcohol dehydrogenase [Cohnella fermenti]
MRSFAYWNPTKLYYGDDQVGQLAAESKKLGSRVLLVYGGGSIHRNGVYDAVMRELSAAGAEVVELSGVEPNPRVSTVRRGAELCREHRIDWVLAAGGGSVIDCAKAIAAAAKYDGDFWDVVTKKATATDALPLGTVLTLAATGSEMNANSVISNADTQEKHGWSSSLVYPRFSILAPSFTATAPLDQTVYGIVDMMSHVFEQYFHHDANAPVQDGFCESILRAVVQTAPKLAADLGNPEHRGTILYCGTVALNGLLSMGIRGDWANHDMEHAVSAVYDIPHGGGLAILFPHWMDMASRKHPEKFAQLGVNVFGVKGVGEGRTAEKVAEEAIAALRAFWTSLGAPARLSDYGIDGSQLERMAGMVTANGPRGHFVSLSREDVLAIYRSAL